ncbi:MAG: hypothetical protein J6E42_08370 [Firmicutes bacterium]|nr:hypothetical protein [Bacillota bacterium]
MMGKGMTLERWKKQCIKAIEVEDIVALRRVLDQSETVEFGWGREEEKYLLDLAMQKENREVLRTILSHPQFSGLGSYVMRTALAEGDIALLDLVLDYTNANLPYYDRVQQKIEGYSAGHIGTACSEGMGFHMTVEPLGWCAVRGKREMAELLLRRGARPEGCTVRDMMDQGKKNYMRPMGATYLEFLFRWEEDGEQYMERTSSVIGLPPWAYAMYCEDLAAAEYFLELGEDRYSLSLALAVSMVRSGPMIRLLRKTKPKLMEQIRPEFILRRFWPDAVREFFADGREIPRGAVSIMGRNLFEEYDIVEEQMKPTRVGFREKEFMETLRFLMERGYRLTKEDLDYLVCVMVVFRSQRLLELLKGRIPKDTDMSDFIDLIPVDEKDWEFGKKLEEAGVRFQCVIDDHLPMYRDLNCPQLMRLFRLVEFEKKDTDQLDALVRSAIFSRSRRAAALVWKRGLLNRKNLAQATEMICDYQIKELYEFIAELAAASGGSEVRYEL